MLLSVTCKGGWTFIHDGRLDDPESMTLAKFRRSHKSQLLATLLAKVGRGDFKYEARGSIIIVYCGCRATALVSSLTKGETTSNYGAIHCHEFYLPSIIKTLKGIK